jgi:hypothetical protein
MMFIIKRKRIYTTCGTCVLRGKGKEGPGPASVERLPTAQGSPVALLLLLLLCALLLLLLLMCDVLLMLLLLLIP